MDSTGQRRSDRDARLNDPIFRADTDAMGRWYVWERLGPGGWVTIEPCVSCEEATRLASEMNSRAHRGDGDHTRADIVDPPTASPQQGTPAQRAAAAEVFVRRRSSADRTEA